MLSKKLRSYLFIILAIFSISLSSQNNRDVQFSNKKNNYRIDSLISEIRLPLDFTVIGFEQIGEAIGDKRIVMIGEEMHCVEEFNLIRLKLIEYLVENKGFEVVLWEANQLQSTIFNVIKDTITDVKFLTQTLHGVWWDSVNLKTMRYIQMKKLDFAGFDYKKSGFYNPVLISQIYQNIDSTIGVQKHILDSLFKIIDEENRTLSNTKLLRLDKRKVLKMSIENNKNKFYKDSDLMLKRLTFVNNKCDNDKTRLLIQALVIQTSDDVEYIKSIKKITNYNLAFEHRDSLMAKNLIWLVNQVYYNKKIIIIAANAHINKNNQGNPLKMNNPMGSRLPEEIINKTYIIGVLGLSGSFNIIPNEKKIKKIKPKSVEDELNKSSYSIGFISFYNTSNTCYPKWIYVPTMFNVFGSTTSKITLKNHYDGIIYFKNVNPSKSWLIKKANKAK